MQAVVCLLCIPRPDTLAKQTPSMATCQHGYYQAAGNHGFLQLGFNQDYPTNHQVGLFTDNQSRSKEKTSGKKAVAKF